MGECRNHYDELKFEFYLSIKNLSCLVKMQPNINEMSEKKIFIIFLQFFVST